MPYISYNEYGRRPMEHANKFRAEVAAEVRNGTYRETNTRSEDEGRDERRRRLRAECED